MKGMLRMGLVAVAALAAACAPRERTLVLLSTNDMHAKIQNFPRLASAVEACRDTAQLVVLVDAGDRWTGNAYVDMAQTTSKSMLSIIRPRNACPWSNSWLPSVATSYPSSFIRAIIGIPGVGAMST